MKKAIIVLIALLLLAFAVSASHGHTENDAQGFVDVTSAAVATSLNKYESAAVYYNEACGMCSAYINNELLPLLKELGVKNIAMKDYISEKQNRIELNALTEKYGIPPNLKGHFMIFIDDKYIFGGHVPKEIITDLLANDYGFEKIYVLQDEMDEAKTYTAWAFRGEPKEYAINAPISEYTSWFNAEKDNLPNPVTPNTKWWALLPLILSAGFLDGINPCAFAVLLFFIAFLYTLHKTRAGIWKMGATYIFAIFLAYFLIGIGLMKTLMFIGSEHLMAKLGAYLIIILGIVNLANFILPDGKKINMGIPHFAKDSVKKWMYKATLPATFILGFLVGLCTFPCSGGIYVAVIGMLSVKATYAAGLIYLVLYNLMFVLPLVILLFAASNKVATEKLAGWERNQSKIIKLVSGLVMLALGIIILLWFVH